MSSASGKGKLPPADEAALNKRWERIKEQRPQAKYIHSLESWQNWQRVCKHPEGKP